MWLFKETDTSENSTLETRANSFVGNMTPQEFNGYAEAVNPKAGATIDSILSRMALVQSHMGQEGPVNATAAAIIAASPAVQTAAHDDLAGQDQRVLDWRQRVDAERRAHGEAALPNEPGSVQLAR